MERRLLQNAEECGLVNIWANANRLERSLYEILDKANSSVLICGLTLHEFQKEKGFVADMVALLNRKPREFRLRLLFLNPYCHYAVAHGSFRRLLGDRDLVEEIEETIESLKSAFGFLKPERKKCLEVKLTNYLPRYRAIIIDDKKCYLAMYMYNSKVKDNPHFLFSNEEGGAGFDTIWKSVSDLYERNDNVLLVADGKWRARWEDKCVQDKFEHCWTQSPLPGCSF